MKNFVEVRYDQSGASSRTNALGMREMQSRAYEYRRSQYLLLKAPPASGKSRALMFIALDKLAHRDVKKVVVAVPERAIGSSFRATDLRGSGFFADWAPDVDLIMDEERSSGKVDAFVSFLNSATARILLCTHATLRFAFERTPVEAFNDVLVAVDEFHHVSADEGENKLGALVHSLIADSSASVLAMTGSYFRGDGVAVLLPEDEERFDKVTYDYYDQLNGYKYLKSLGIGFHFYQGKYTSAIGEILDTDKKTLIHIPSVNSRESTGDKYEEVDRIVDVIGESLGEESASGILRVRRADGKILRVANLVEDEPRKRDKLVAYLRGATKLEDVDIIIALGMAKEGFDWPWCEVTLTVGYRGSLTEIVQIIGRCTRDSSNKTHAQFTNLVVQPDADDEDVANAVNDVLKAIACSLLMEQVMAPSYKFKTKVPLDDSVKGDPNTIEIKGFREPSTERTKKIVENDLRDLKAAILQDDDALAGYLSGEAVDIKFVNETIIPKIVRRLYPDLSDDEVEEIRQYAIADSVFKNASVGADPKIVVRPVFDDEDAQEDAQNDEEREQTADRRLIETSRKFIDLDDLSFDLIESINPFQSAYEILSKTLDARVFGVMSETIRAKRIPMTLERAYNLFPEINKFCIKNGRDPDIRKADPREQELAAALRTLRVCKQKQKDQRHD